MKKISLALFSILAVASIVSTACGRTVTVATPIPAPTVTLFPTAMPLPTAALKTYQDLVVGFLSPDAFSDWHTANMISFEETAANLGVQLLRITDSRAMDNDRQKEYFRAFIGNPEVNVIVLYAMISTGWNDLLKEAKVAGKIVILDDRPIDAPEDLYVTLVGPDMTEEGRKAGAAMNKLLPNGGKIIELSGTPNSGAAVGRAKGFRQNLNANIEILDSKNGDFTRTEGKPAMEALLKKYAGQIDGAFIHNDDMSIGAVEVIKAAGLNPGDIKIVSIDSTRGGLQLMIDGWVQANIECNPMFAPQVYEAALKALNGETLPKWIPVKEGVFRMDDPNLKEIAAGRKY
jgi:galactofuranose transport system substrate-binding protein